MSILIPTLHARKALCGALCADLQQQVSVSSLDDAVEILTLPDDGAAFVGEKRNQLIDMARGRFVVFIDDDDTVSERYVTTIVNAILQNDHADCISFAGEITFAGKHARRMVHSIKHHDWCHSNGEYLRPPCHITPIRRAIAGRYKFANKDYAEDMDWTLRMNREGALQHEVLLEDVLYYYQCRRRYSLQWILDRTQTARHAMGLRFTGGKMTDNSSSQKPTMLFVSNGFTAYGGGNCVVAWSLMALRETWDITFFCAQKPDFKAINRHFGTDLQASDFSIRKLPFPLNKIKKLDPDPFSIQQLAWMMRICQSQSHKYDMVMSCDDEVDFGRPGLQYTHYPHLRNHLDALRTVENLSPRQRLGKLLSGKLRPWLWVSRISLARIKRNLMVTNSNWTANLLRETYGVEPVVVYPPVRWGGPETPVSERRNAFVCLGRFNPEKRYVEIIDIIERVRARGFDVELEIIGDKDAISKDEYVQAVENRIKKAGNWARKHISVSREELEELVSGCRYGIHGMLDEHFGIAPAELMRAGCIVFVPNSGGQVEIIGENPELRYESDDDAVEKICRVLADEETRNRLQNKLAEQSALFSETHFMEHIRQVAADFAKTDR